MATKIKGKGSVADFAKNLIAGTAKHVANETQVTFAAGSFTPAQITAKLQTLVNLRDGVDAAKAAAKTKLAAEKADMPALRTFMAAYVAYVKAVFGGSPEVLADFGIHPKARAPLTVEAKAAADAKRKATREARHVMGSKQRKRVKGAVTGVVITPTAAPQPAAPAPASPSAPATSAGTTAPATPHTS